MKKIALLLAVVFVFSAFVVACDPVEDTSSASSDSSAISEESKDPTADYVLTGNPVNENPNETIVSNGSSYTKSVEAGVDYPDTYGTELTDGIRCETTDGTYSDSALSGYQSLVTVVLDLGTVRADLYKFKVGYLSFNDAGISEPTSISVSASVDGAKWTRVGNLNKTVPPEDNPKALEGTVQEASLQVGGYIRGRYIKFDVRMASAWVFLDEVMVIADVDSSQQSGKYKEAVNSAYQTLGCVSKPSSDTVIDRELEKVLISEGVSYTVNGNEKTFSDKTKKMLTDGRISGYYEGETWVGYDLSSDVTITLDLGKEVTDIASVEANFYTNTSTNVFLPVAVKVAAIDNSNNRTELGIIYGNTVIVAGDFAFALPFDTAVTARYVEFTFVATETNLVMVEELAVYAYRNVDKKQLYPSFTFEDSYTEWGSEGSNEYINLLSGLTPNIVATSDPGEDNYKNNTPVTSKLLTDGVLAKNTDIHNGKFFKFSNGGSRTVYFDLQHLSAIDKVTAGFVERTEWAVRRPSRVVVYVSQDANHWYSLGELVLNGEGENCIYRGEIVLGSAVNVRYIALNFDVGAWVGCDEIEVFGKKNSSGSNPADKYELSPGVFATKRIEPSEELLGGAKDLCLMYHSQDYNYSPEELLPYVSYVDSEGVPQDIMFDSMLFLYNNTRMPSGGQPYNGSIMTDWQWTIDDLFADGQNIMALEEVVGQVKETLGLPEDYKYKFAVTLYYPIKFDDNGNVVAHSFGDVDGDGTPETTKTLEERLKIVDWYIDAVENKVAECNFENIELVAYYWWHEAIEKFDTDGLELLNGISDKVHNVGKDFIWIPYYCASGYNLWAEHGFDVACMQPNYVFDEEAAYSKIIDCANLTQLYGMGFEVEIDSPSLTKALFYRKYLEYLGSGATLGYMNDTINMYYQSVSVYYDAATSDSLMARNVYDQTYHYIKGDLQYNPDAITGLNFESSQNTPSTFEIGFTNEMPRNFRVESMPESGTVTFNNDGTFTYYPEKDFTGEVKFTFAYNEYLGWSDVCEVVINVK